MNFGAVQEGLSITREAEGASLRRQLKLALWAWFFGALWMYTINGALLVQFARELGMPDYGFGLLGALPFAGSLAQLPASYLIERFGHRKAVFIVSATFSRLMWALAAALPWLLPIQTTKCWPALLMVIFFSWLAGHFSTPPWMNWMADVVPRRLRGRYFSLRSRLGQGVGLATTLAIAALLDLGQRADAGPESGYMLRLTSVALAIAGLLGVLDIQLFTRIPDRRITRPARQGHWLGSFTLPLRDPSFRCYLAFNFTFMLAVGFIGQYIWLFVFDEVGLSNITAHVVLLFLPITAMVLTYSFWGRMIDRLGKKPVMLIAGSVVTFGSAAWVLVGPEGHWWWYLAILPVSASWPGLEIANFNFILDQSSRQTDRQSGPAFVALNSLAIAAGGVLSGLLSSAVAATCAGFSWRLDFFNVTITYHGLLFLCSTVLRGVALLFVLGLREPAATATRDAMAYVSASLYSNFRQALLLPAVVVGRISRWSYRIAPGPRGPATRGDDSQNP